MRFPRPTLLLALPVAALALAACSNSDKVTTAVRPPLAGVRYVHAIADTGRVDIKMYDQLEYSANTVDGVGGVAFRAGTRYYPTEAKARKIRVFSFQDSSLTTVQQVLIDTTITFEANKNYTLLLVGSARAAAGSAGRVRFVRLEDAPATDNAQVLTRYVNATDAAVDGYMGVSTDTATANFAPSGTPTFANVASRATSAYVARAAATSTQTMFVATTATGSTTATSRRRIDNGTAGTAAANPIAGARIGGTAFSAIVFPGSVPGSGAEKGASNAALTGLRAQLTQVFVDRLPPNTVQ